MIGSFARGSNSFDAPGMSLRLADYDYALPEELIAQRPLPRRDDSRMMVLDRTTSVIEHRNFSEIERFLAAGRFAGFEQHPRDSGAAIFG